MPSRAQKQGSESSPGLSLCKWLYKHYCGLGVFILRGWSELWRNAHSLCLVYIGRGWEQVHMIASGHQDRNKLGNGKMLVWFTVSDALQVWENTLMLSLDASCLNAQQTWTWLGWIVSLTQHHSWNCLSLRSFLNTLTVLWIWSFAMSFFF